MRKATGGKGKDAAGIKAALQALGAAPEPPLIPLLLVCRTSAGRRDPATDSRTAESRPVSNDGGDFLDGDAMNRDNRTKSAASMSKLWDPAILMGTCRRRAGKFYGRRLALHLMVQPVIAEAVLSDELLIGQGFLPRCLLAWPQSTIGTRRYVEAICPPIRPWCGTGHACVPCWSGNRHCVKAHATSWNRAT